MPLKALGYALGQVLGSADFVDLKETPDRVRTAIAMLVRNIAHLSRLLRDSQYPDEKT